MWLECLSLSSFSVSQLYLSCSSLRFRFLCSSPEHHTLAFTLFCSSKRRQASSNDLIISPVVVRPRVSGRIKPENKAVRGLAESPMKLGIRRRGGKWCRSIPFWTIPKCKIFEMCQVRVLVSMGVINLPGLSSRWRVEAIL